MNRYPLWKYLLIATVLLVGFLYALPNLYGEDPALQISSTRGAKVDASTEARIKVLLQEAGIASHGSELNPGSLLIRFGNTGGQLKAQDLVKRELGDDYIVAPNLAPTTPTWLRAIGAKPMYLGLDLRGGVHILMQVDMAAVMQQTAERYVEDLRLGLRNDKIRYLAVARRGNGVEIKFQDAAERGKANEHIRKNFPELQLTERDGVDGPLLVAQPSEKQLRETQRFAVQQNITTLRNRVNELGVADPVVQQQGEDRIVVQLPGVSITLDGKGARAMQNTTQENVGKLMAVVFIENKTETRYENGQAVKTKKRVEEVINRATIREAFSKRFQITGLSSPEEARNLALLLRAGALSAPIDIVEERTVGPSLGQENIDKGFVSFVIGFTAIVLFMSMYYRVFGAIASLSLFMNLVLLLSVLSMLQATLTLPGIAGIALTIGMAIDANVLIFERVREELRIGNTPQAAIHAGYERAWGTILDSNITTLIAGIALFLLGSGPVRGFAVVLCIGILTSMFSGVLVSRAMVNLFYGQRKVGKLAI